LIKAYKGVDLALYLSTSKIDLDSKVGALFTAFVRDEKMDLLFLQMGQGIQESESSNNIIVVSFPSE